MVNFLPDMCYSLSMTEYGDQFAEAIAEELRAQKARMGKTNDDIADEVGLSPVTVLRYLKGQRQIPIDVFGDLCKALGANAADMTRIAYEFQSTHPVRGATVTSATSFPSCECFNPRTQ